MIYFNDIPLDYKEGGLFPLEIVKSLGELQTLSERKGTASKTFELPATPTNNIAFKNLWLDGVILSTISGECKIYNDNLIYSVGTLFVQGIQRNGNPIKYSCTFQGNDIDFIRTIKDKSLRDLDLGLYHKTDAAVRSDLGSEANYLSKHFYWGHPQITDLVNSATKVLSADTIGLYYSLKELVKEIIADYDYDAEILDIDYLQNRAYGGYEGNGKYYSRQLFNPLTTSFETGASGTPPLLIKHLQGGTAITSSDIVTNNTNAFKFKRDSTSISANIDIDITMTDDVDNVGVFFRVSGNVDFRSDAERVTESGNYKFNFRLDYDSILLDDELEILVEYNYKSGTSAPYTGCQVVANSIEIGSNNFEDGDYVLIQEFLPNISQLDFLKGFLKQYNLLLDMDENNKIYIAPRQKVTAYSTVDGADVEIDAIYTSEFDITKYVDEFQNNDFQVFDKRFYALDTQVDNFDLIDFKPIVKNKTYGGFLFDLGETIENGVERYTTIFKQYLGGWDAIGAIGTNIDIDPVDSWENSLVQIAPLIGGAYDTLTTGYTNQDATETTVDYFLVTSFGVKFSELAPEFFSETIEQIKLKRITTVNLKVNKIVANKINFRTKLILNNQFYQLNKLNYDIEKQIMKVELILI